MNCRICNRPLKKATPDGVGRVCASKAHRLQDSSEEKTVKIQLVYDNGRGHRNYLVDRQFVTVHADERGRIATCKCADYRNGIFCEHLKLVRDEDSRLFAEPPVARAA